MYCSSLVSAIFPMSFNSVCAFVSLRSSAFYNRVRGLAAFVLRWRSQPPEQQSCIRDGPEGLSESRIPMSVHKP